MATMRQYAAAVLAAGFTGEHAAEAVAVGWAESTGDVHAVNDSSGARGPWQFHPFWHREVSDACAFDLSCAAKAAYRVSNGGRDWSQWSTWPDAARGHLPAARRAVGAPARATTSPAGVANPLNPDNGLPGLTNLPGWLGFLGGAAAETAAANTAREAAMELVRAAAPVVLTVALVGGGLALVLVGARNATRPATASSGGNGGG